ncbi:MAG: HlyD family secretion protein [Opitutales bacterium]
MSSSTDNSSPPASAPAAEASPAAAAPPPASRNPGRVLGVLALLLIVAASVAGYYIFFAPYESTDDAFVEGDVTSVAPQVAGRILRVFIHDNQFVNAGDPLLDIDPSDYQVKLDEMRAGLAAARNRLDQAKAQLGVDQAKADQEQASVVAAQADAARAQADLQRYQSVDSRAVARSQVDLVQDQAQDSAAQVDVAKNRARAAVAQVVLSQANVDTSESEVHLAEAYEHQAELNLSYTHLVAATPGHITRRSVEPGSYVEVGETLLAIVQPDTWVLANFKETQLAHMRPGQPVTISVDAFPQFTLKGHVDSVQSGSGARFSLLPPENATGNYVKVVQRVPVKIVFDGPLPDGCVLSPGMSVVPTVKVQ